MFVYLDTSKMHNLHARFSQFTNQKKSEMIQAIQIELPKIALLQGLKYKLILTGHLLGKFYDSKTQLIQAR